MQKARRPLAYSAFRHEKRPCPRKGRGFIHLSRLVLLPPVAYDVNAPGVEASFAVDGAELDRTLSASAAVLGALQRGAYLRNNLHRAALHTLRQFRYVRFLKADWRRRLRLPIEPYPKPDEVC